MNKVLGTLILCVLMLVVALAPSTAEAVVDAFMNFPGLPGEATARGHEGEIDVLSYTQTAGGGACFKAIVIKQLDKASPGLALLAVTNQLVSSVTINLDRAGDTPFNVLTVELENVVVGNVELVEFEGSLTTTERVTLRPRRAILTYRLQNPTGGVTPFRTVINCP
jgi:type VI protein secretion system component Hcp